MHAWNRTTDVMLVFVSCAAPTPGHWKDFNSHSQAAVFSAVLTTFLAQSYQQLSPNPQDVTNSLLLSISDSLRSPSTGFNSSVPAGATSPAGSNFVPSKSALWINGLWFASLTCSLGVCSVAMLVKQWLNAYVFGLPATHHLRAQARQYRYDALITWRTDHIINSLPLAMSFCLMLFLGGLSIMLFSLSTPIALISIAITAVMFIFHFLNLVLPAVCDCPWKTAISPVMFRLFAPLRATPSQAQFSLWAKQIRKFFVVFLMGCLYGVSLMVWCILIVFWIIPRRLACIFNKTTAQTQDYFNLCQDMILSALQWILSALITPLYALFYLPCRWLYKAVMNLWQSPSEADHEESMVLKNAATLASCAIVWLMHTSTKQAVVDHSAQAISGLPADTGAALILHQSRAPQIIRDRLRSCFRGKELHSPKEAEMYARGLLRLHVAVRILNEGHAMESRRDDVILARALSISPSTESRSAVIACMCAGAMLHEMVATLEQHFEGVNPLSPFQLWLLVDTLGQEIAWRKRPEVNHWTKLPMGGWGGLLPRVLPILIHLLDPQSSSWAGTSDPLPVDTAIAFTIAMFTQGHPVVDVKTYMVESRRKLHFHYLIITALTPILRFPDSFGCGQELVDVARTKYEVATEIFARNRHLLHLLDRSVLRELLRWSSSQTGDNHLILALSQMETEAIATLDCNTVLQVFPSGMLRLPFLDLLERMCEECSRDAEFARSGVTRFLSLVMCSPESAAHTKSQAFRVLIRIAHQLCASSNSLIEVMIDEDLLGTLREFFKDSAFVRQEDVDRCIIMLSGLCKSHTSVVAASGVIQTLIDWARRYWRNLELMWKHKHTLAVMASGQNINLDLWEDTSWFKPTCLYLSFMGEFLGSPVFLPLSVFTVKKSAPFTRRVTFNLSPQTIFLHQNSRLGYLFHTPPSPISLGKGICYII